jgi:hypothetical protein
VSRIDERTLVSSSGKVYKLKGELDVEGMLLNGKANLFILHWEDTMFPCSIMKERANQHVEFPRISTRTLQRISKWISRQLG